MSDKLENSNDDKKSVEVKNLIDLLIKERDYHSSHPREAYYKFLYSLGASLAAVIVSVYFSGKSTKDELLDYINGMPINIILMLFLFGLISITIGFMEHGYLHKQQREKIEDALKDIFEHLDNFEYEAFWNKHSSNNLKLYFKYLLKKKTPLFTLEPDTRRYWNFHDRKLELGVILIFIGYAFMICHAFIN
jgi:hypothetical protein